MVAPKKFGRRYPWETWFARKRFTLVRGRDYDCLTHGMAQTVRNAAASDKFRVKVRLEVLEDEIVGEVVGKLPPRRGRRAGGSVGRG